ncbi:MAG: outer membrane beta-barrel protein, partial [Candidatus Solibacter sp.]|nr:outer membrane beta-barrel protein [Candidatus Solibacter sp.]
SGVALKFFLVGLLAAGACLAQNWVIGGGLGYGAYRNVTITSSGGSATAGIRNHAVVTGAVTEDLFDHFSGEFRYVYHSGDTFLSSGSSAGGVKAQSHVFLYDALIHLKPRTERIRPFVAGGVGAKYYDTTGTVPSPQPLPRIASLTTQSQWKPLFDFGAGVKVRIADRVVVSGDFRDYLTVFPDRLISPAAGATRQGMLHQFTPTFSVGYNF